MGGRRLILTSYSDEEDNDEQDQLQQSPTSDGDQNNHQLFPNAVLDNVPITIPSSPEDDYIDVPEDFSPHSNVSRNVPSSNYDGCPVGELLSSKGLKLRREWINTCLAGINPSRNVHELSRICFEKFLESNMNTSGAGILPSNVHLMHLVDLPGPFVLQVDEIVNLGCPLKSRYHETPAGVKRCLKLSMTDGFQRVFGIEYRPIKELKVFSPAGLKIVVCNVHVRRGLLLLVPEAIEMLGGIVEELELARQRLVFEVTKPSRGRSRVGDALSLSTRATNAAWNSQNSVEVTEERRSSELTEANNITIATNPSSISTNNINGYGMNTEMNRNLNTSYASHHVNIEEIEIFENGETNPSVNVSSHVNEGEIEDHERNTANPSVNVSNLGSVEEVKVIEHMEANPPLYISNGIDREDTEIPESRESVNLIHNQSVDNSSRNLDEETFEILDESLPNDVMIIENTEEENPFQYLADLSTKWAEVSESSPLIQGKIKCFLTGVKGFQYKNRKTYDLRVFVDDGSLISEILIDHKLVQERINHTPEEATLALSSPDSSKVRDMKGKLKNFQVFLINFEGSMVIEMNHQSPVPIAITMEQGCSSSYLSLLLNRLKSELIS